MKTLKEYLALLERENVAFSHTIPQASLAKEVALVSYDSRDLAQNTLFICKGSHFKKEYLEKAVLGGAICYLAEKSYDDGFPCIITPELKRATALFAAMFYDYSFKKLTLIGLTGTKGKSSTSFFLKYMLDDWLLGQNKPQAGILSTITTFDGVETKPAQLTTPEPLELHRHFKNAADSGLEYLLMEVSSQALKYHRVHGVDYTVCGFLNISPDHVGPGEHTDYEDYLSSKLKIFDLCKTACVHIDSDPRVLQAAGASALTFGQRPEAAVYGYAARKEGGHLVFRGKTAAFDAEFRLDMVGFFNVDNALAAIAIATVLGVPLGCMQSGLAKAHVEGRMEVYTKGLVTAVVDYAHNRVSFESMLSSLRREFPQHRIVSIFGCPGEKAPVRRRDLGEVADAYSDHIILTEDDPAGEAFLDICSQIIPHIKGSFQVVEARKEAIEKGIFEAKVPTVLFIAGKGAEKFMKYGTEKVPSLSDGEMVCLAFEKFK